MNRTTPLDGLFWAFPRDAREVPTDERTLYKQVRREERLLKREMPDHVIYDAENLFKLSGMNQLYARFYVFSENKYRTVLLGTGQHEMTWGEILIEIHRATLALPETDHIFFEEMKRAPQRAKDGIPLFDIHMGS